MPFDQRFPVGAWRMPGPPDLMKVRKERPDSPPLQIWEDIL